MREPFIILNKFQYLIQYLHSQIQQFHYTLNRIYHYYHYLSFIRILHCIYPHILHCSIATIFYTFSSTSNYIRYSLLRIYHLSDILRFNHLSIYFAVHLLFIFSYYCIFSILYRGSLPCTGNVEPSLYGSKWPVFIISLFDISQQYLWHKSFQDFFLCFPFYSVSLHLESNYPLNVFL